MTAVAPTAVDPSRYVRDLGPDIKTLDLTVANVHCASCINRIETALLSEPGVVAARVNLSTSRLRMDWRAGAADPRRLMDRVAALGYPVAPFHRPALGREVDADEAELLRCLAASGFAAANIMLLSVAVWAGAFSDMGAATRDLFHWISALIAMPAVVYAGRPFFRAAFAALKAGSVTMDVPISLGVILASAMSLFETVRGGEHAYFDASVTLLFFLLVGRYLDRRARARVRSTAEHLLALGAATAIVTDASGERRAIPAIDVVAGMVVFVAPGERIPADGVLLKGATEVDVSLVTGETMPKTIEAGEQVFAGTINLSAPAQIGVTAAGPDTLLAEIVRLMEAAEQSRARYVRLADRVARLYSPVVHLTALAAFLGWMVLGGLAWQAALLIAVAVLIITCPCALGLAVPAVQVVASGLLLKRGILMKAADALERLAEVDTIVFDKTGTLTLGRPELLGSPSAEDLAAAAALASGSRHPLSRALRRSWRGPRPAAEAVREVPGCGIEGEVDGVPMRLGSRRWCGADRPVPEGGEGPELWLARPGRPACRFVFQDALRADAAATVQRLRRLGYGVRILSGDRTAVVAQAASALGIDDWAAEQLPGDKVRALESLAAQGRKVLMVGDGLNDAPALAAGFVSMSPASAADISQTTADLVFQGEGLAPVERALLTACASTRVVRENLAFAILYNAVAVPVAIAGLATPLIAAIAMSASSLVVTLNALCLRFRV